jgi:dsRNA-specific ribonuclease
VGGKSSGRGQGRSKKQAEQMAARDAWFRLKTDLDATGAVAGGAH